MGKGTLGTRLQTYRQYCDLVDEAMASVQSPLINGLPAAQTARELIEGKRFFLIKTPDYLLLFGVYSGYAKLFYIARENAALAIPEAGVPIIVDHVRQDAREYPLFDALMERSAFQLERVNVGMERNLDDTLKRETYAQRELPENLAVGFAAPGDLRKIDKLLRASFKPALDELPGKKELSAMIAGEDALVIRDRQKIAAVQIRIPKGSSAMLHWVAVDPQYRDLRLSGLIQYEQDLDSKNRGYRRSVIWVNKTAIGWIRALERRGYMVSGQCLYSYIYGSKGR